MTSEVRSFDFSGYPLRVVPGPDGSPLFVARDACSVLGLTNGRDVIAAFPDDEKGVADVYTPGGTQKMAVLSEPGLYRLIFGSRKAEAEAFRRWVTHEVLPSIRKTGSYSAASSVPKTLSEALRLAADLEDQRVAMQATISVLEPKAAVHDAIVAADGHHSVAEAAKLMGTGQRRLFTVLRDARILNQHNVPYQEYIDRGYFVVREHLVSKGSLGASLYPQTFVTGKGLAWIQSRVLKTSVPA